MSIDKMAGKAATERIWSHTVGIANRALAETGKDPVTGLKAYESEKPGTGMAGTWGGQYFVQTAKHVVEQAEPRDLRFFVRQVGELQLKHASELVVTDGVAAIELNDPDAVIHRCEWEDLAIITTRPNALGPNLEFFDVENSWVDAAEGQIVSGIGYPLSSSVRFPKRVGSVLEQAVLLSAMPFNGSVLPNPVGDELKFKFSGFDAERHFLIPYEHSEKGMRPEGISGAGVWVEAEKPHVIWTASFKFAGICTSCYRGTVEQIVKASAVRKFLTEVFSTPKA
jgi:hypothetical protein